jgi:hypothetical protein
MFIKSQERVPKLLLIKDSAQFVGNCTKYFQDIDSLPSIKRSTHSFGNFTKYFQNIPYETLQNISKMVFSNLEEELVS